MDLSIVAPMYNEEDNVLSTFSRLKNVLEPEGINWEIIFVNDGSTDKTFVNALELAKKEPRLKVIGYEKNTGAGKALREGFKAAQGEYIISVDFDLSYSAEQVLNLYKTLSSRPDLDALFGSCYKKGGRVEGVDSWRLFVSWLGNVVLSIVFGGRVHTVTCVFRGYKKNIIKSLILSLDTKDIHLEILAQLISRKKKIAEIPAVLRVRKKGKSKFRFWKTSKNHLRFIFLYFLGGYRTIVEEKSV